MAAVLASALLIAAASLGAGLVVLAAAGERRPSPLAGAIGFAALTIACPLLIRLPGRATTAAVVVGVVLAVAALWLRGRVAQERAAPPGHGWAALATGLAVLALGCAPFALNQEVGVLGEGIYTNDQAAQLYWTDWLQHGFGPEPSAVQFGYPTGPQALTATAAQTLGVDLDDAFNGLLLAIPVLTALAALAAVPELTAVRRVVAATLAGVTYLGASFLAQSAFKETAMGLLVLSFAIALDPRALAAARARAAALLAFAGAAFFTYSVPGLVWFAGTLLALAAIQLVRGELELPVRAWLARAREHRRVVAVVALVGGAIVVAGAVQGAGFIDKIGNVQASAGRLSSPVWPGEALGVWPEGDFRVVRGEVSGAYPATLLGVVLAAAGVWLAWRRGRVSLLAALLAAGAVYVGARAFASIYVEAKALAVMAPLVVLVVLAGLLGPRDAPAERSRGAGLRLAAGVIAAVAFLASTLLALRAAPVGFDGRGEELETLAARIQGERVAFLGVDRFAGYWLRGTLAESPGGYVPAEIRARRQKAWQQGTAMDLDTLPSGKLNSFDYAITTTAAYQSSPPEGMRELARSPSYVLWQRAGKVPPAQVLGAGASRDGEPEDGAPGVALDCAKEDGRALMRRHGMAVVLPEPVVGDPGDWSRPSPMDAGASSSQELALGPGRWLLSLQYHSQVPLTVSAAEHEVALPASLVGMYLNDFAGGTPQDAFWPAGQVDLERPARVRVDVTAAAPTSLQDALGVPRKVWLGQIAATRFAPPRTVALADACDRYVDRYTMGR